MALFRTGIKEISPGFLRNGTGERYMYTFGLLLDAFMQKMVESQLAHMPTKCDVSFLSVIGSDRLIGQGITESVDSYRVRLQKAFESWQLAGNSRSVLAQTLGYLLAFTPQARVVSSRYALDPARLPNALVRQLGVRATAASNTTPILLIVDDVSGFSSGDSVTVTGVAGNTAANGTWTVTVTASLNQLSLDTSVGNGAYTGGGRAVLTSDIPTVSYPPAYLGSNWDTYTAGADTNGNPVHVSVGAAATNGVFDWDGALAVTGSYGWWGIYGVFYATAPQAWVTSSGTWGQPGKWGDGAAIGVSGAVGRVNGLRTVFKQWMRGGAWLRWIIVSFDDALFDPGQPADGISNPDGTFGRWSKVVNGQYVPARFANARYADGGDPPDALIV